MPVRSRAVIPLLVCLVTLGALLLASVENASGAGWTWKSKGKIPGVSGSADAVSCPTTALCVAAGSDRIYWTTTPTGLGRAWKSVRFAPTGSAIGGGYITTEVDCPTATLCVAGDSESNVLTSTAPTSGLAGWVRSPLPSDSYVGVQALSCASTTLTVRPAGRLRLRIDVGDAGRLRQYVDPDTDRKVHRSPLRHQLQADGVRRHGRHQRPGCDQRPGRPACTMGACDAPGRGAAHQHRRMRIGAALPGCR